MLLLPVALAHAHWIENNIATLYPAMRQRGERRESLVEPFNVTINLRSLRYSVATHLGDRQILWAHDYTE